MLRRAACRPGSVEHARHGHVLIAEVAGDSLIGHLTFVNIQAGRKCGAALPVIVASGKFHGVIAAQVPTG